MTGELVREDVLGARPENDGAARRSARRFSLRQRPLQIASASGAAPTAFWAISKFPSP